MPGALDKLGKVASDLVTKFGKTATLTRVSVTFDQNTGTSTETATPETVIATPPEPFKEGRRNEPGRTGGTSIQKGDSIASLAALDVAKPAIGDRITFGPDEFQIVDVGTVWSGENPALYEVGLEA